MLLFIYRLITSDLHIEETDFEHNYIGDAAGREILHPMQQRKDGNTINTFTSLLWKSTWLPPTNLRSFLRAKVFAPMILYTLYYQFDSAVATLITSILVLNII